MNWSPPTAPTPPCSACRPTASRRRGDPRERHRLRAPLPARPVLAHGPAAAASRWRPAAPRLPCHASDRADHARAGRRLRKQVRGTTGCPGGGARRWARRRADPRPLRSPVLLRARRAERGTAQPRAAAAAQQQPGPGENRPARCHRPGRPAAPGHHPHAPDRRSGAAAVLPSGPDGAYLSDSRAAAARAARAAAGRGRAGAAAPPGRAHPRVGQGRGGTGRARDQAPARPGHVRPGTAGDKTRRQRELPDPPAGSLAAAAIADPWPVTATR